VGDGVGDMALGALAITSELPVCLTGDRQDGPATGEPIPYVGGDMTIGPLAITSGIPVCLTGDRQDGPATGEPIPYVGGDFMGDRDRDLSDSTKSYTLSFLGDGVVYM